MTGNVHNNAVNLNNVQLDPANNRPNHGAPQIAINPNNAVNAIAGLPVVANNQANPVLSPQMALKFEDIKNFADTNIASLTMDRLVNRFLSFTENDATGTKKCLFRQTADLRNSEELLKNLTVKMVAQQVFGKKPEELNGDEKKLSDKLEQTLSQVMKAAYVKNTAAGADSLNQVFDALTAKMTERSPNHTLTDAQKAFLKDTKDFYTGIVIRQPVTDSMFRKFINSDTKITLENPRNIFGMGALFPTAEETIDHLINNPAVSAEEIARKIDSGDSTVMQMMEEKPEYQELLKDYSENFRGEIESAIQNIGTRLEETRNLITGHDMDNDTKNTVIGKISEIVKDLRAIRNEADSKLTSEDRAALFTGDNTYESQLKKALDTLKGMYQPGAAEQQSIELLKNHPMETVKLLDSLGFSQDIFSEFIKTHDALECYFKISDATAENISNEDFKSAINSLAGMVFDPHLDDDSSLLLSIMKGIATDKMSPAQQIIMEHLPQKLELTQDVFDCLSQVLSGLDIANAPVTPASINMDNLRKAYLAICNPSEDLKNIMHEHGGNVTMQHLESFVLRAAYHLFRAEHAAEDQNEYGKDFRANKKFRHAMGIALEGRTTEQRPVDISRYNGFNPLKVRIEDMSVGRFVTTFNLLCTNNDFLEAAKKLPAVHLADRVGKALNIDLKKAFENSPALKSSYESQQSPAARLEWFQEHLPELVQLFMDHEGIVIKALETENKAAVDSRRNDINNMNLQDLVDLNNLNAKEGENGLKPISSVEELLVNTNSIKGGKEISYLVSILNQLSARRVTDFIPSGKTFLNLTADDFRNPASSEKIRSALAGATESVVNSPEYKEAFLFFAMMQKGIAMATDKNAIMTEKYFNGITLDDADITAAFKKVRGEIASYQTEGLKAGTEFEVLDRKDYLLSDLKSYCKSKSSLNRRNRAEILSSIKLTEKMFNPENNIFVKDKASGKAKYKAIKAAITAAVETFISTDKSSRSIMGELIAKVNNELAGDKTLGIATAVTMLIPHNDNEVIYDAGHDMIKSVEKDIKGLFSKSMVKSGTPIFRQIVSNVSFYSRNNIFFVNSMLDQMKEFSISRCASLDAVIKNNRFASLMVEKSLRKVAYENNFKTVADLKLAFMKDEGNANATKDQLISLVVKELKKDFATLDDNTLRNIVLGAVESDIYGKNTGKSSKVWASIKQIGRCIRDLGLLNPLKGLKKNNAVKMAARQITQKSVGETRHLAKAMLESLTENTAIVHTAQGGFSFGVELNPSITANEKDKFTIKAGIKLTDGMDLHIQTDGPGRYRFVMGASIGAKLFGEAGLENNTDVGGVQADVGGGYKRTYTVTFDSLKKASAFLSKIMVARLSSKDIASAESFNTSHMIQAGAHASASVDPVAAFQRKKGVEVTSGSNPVISKISAGAGADGEWTYEHGVNHYRHSVHSNIEVQTGFEVSLSPRNIVLGNVDKDKLTAEEKAEYERKEASLDFADIFLQSVLDPQKAVKKNFSDPESARFVDHMSSHTYTDEDKDAWGKLSFSEKFEADDQRLLAEQLAGFISGYVVDPVVKDLASLKDFLLKKMAGLVNADKLMKSLTDFFGRVSTVLNGPHTRFSFEASLGDTSKILSVKGGVKASWDSTLSYETNALETSIRSAEKVTTIKVETAGGDSNIKQRNIEFLKTSLKKMGFGNKEITKAVAYLNMLQKDQNVSISDFEIHRSAKKSALHQIRGKLKMDQAPGKQYKGLVKSLKNEDFELSSIVFRTTNGHHNQNYGISVNAGIMLGTETQEQQTSIENHTLTFS